MGAWSGRSSGALDGVALRPVDLGDEIAVEAALNEWDPQVIVHAAAVSSPAAALKDPALTQAVNVRATSILAGWAWYRSVRMIFCSTDMVFDGRHGGYTETDEPSPVSIYGKSKLEAELAVADLPRGMAVRLSLLYGPGLHGRITFFDQMAAALRSRQRLRLFEDEWRTPLSLADAAAGLIAACDSSATGIYHLGGPERMSRLEMGRRLAAAMGVSDRGIEPVSRLNMAGQEERPADLSLDSAKWDQQFPDFHRQTLEDAIRGIR